MYSDRLLKKEEHPLKSGVRIDGLWHIKFILSHPNPYILNSDVTFTEAQLYYKNVKILPAIWTNM